MAGQKPLTPRETAAMKFLIDGYPSRLRPPELQQRMGGDRSYSNDLLARLQRKGLVEAQPEPRLTGRPGSSYRVVDGHEGFARVASAYLETLAATVSVEEMPQAGLVFLDTAYARGSLNEGFVRHVLTQREIVMPRTVYLDEKGEEADSLAHHETFHADLRIARDTSDVASARRDAYASIEYRRTDAHRSGLQRWIERHYAEFEPQRLVRPLLCLVQVSQAALRVFIGDWTRNPDPVAKGWNMTGTRQVEHVLFSMIYRAIADLEKTRAIPKGMDASWAAVSPEPAPVWDGLPRGLVIFQWREEATIGFTAGFIASRPVAYNHVTTWWSPKIVFGPIPPSRRLPT